jgi:hypothetical protein
MTDLNDGRDLVLFLGAGFSRPAGLPLMGEFWSGSQIDLTNLRKYAAESSRDAAPILVEAGESFGHFREYCVRSGCMAGEDDNLESLICIVEAMKEVGIQNVPIDGSLMPVAKLDRMLKLWIWKVYQQCPLNPPAARKRGGTPGICDRTLDLFLDALPDRMTVVTTNYDLIVEYLAAKRGIRSRYPIDGCHARLERICNAGELYVALDSDPIAHQFQLPICKLHGSVNLFEDADRADDQLIIAADMGDGTPIGQSGRWTKAKGPTILAVDALTCLRGKHGNSLAPAFIPPTYAKLTGTRWVRSIWSAAYHALTKARAIIFIGYSFPPSDGFMRAMLQAAMAHRTSTDRPRIFVIDRSHDVICRYRCLFGTVDAVCERLETAVSGSLQSIVDTCHHLH